MQIWVELEFSLALSSEDSYPRIRENFKNFLSICNLDSLAFSDTENDTDTENC